MSNDPEQEYFSNGIAEEILNSLASLDELKVAGRSSSFQYSTKSTSLREIGQKLGVSTVLEGSVRKQGKRLRRGTTTLEKGDAKLVLTYMPYMRG